MYDVFIEIVKKRRSVRRLKPDPIPDKSVEAVLEAARWAMSGANAQPWEFIVVRDPETKKKLADAYRNITTEYSYWIEQQRIPELRHHRFSVEGADVRKRLDKLKKAVTWDHAPVLIVVLGDGRKQWSSIMGVHTMGRYMTHLTDGLANACQLIHLAAASLGLGSQWLTITIQEPFKRILNVPDAITLYTIIPLGYSAVEQRTGYRRRLAELTHYEHYDMTKYLSDEDVINYIRNLRQQTLRYYH